MRAWLGNNAGGEEGMKGVASMVFLDNGSNFGFICPATAGIRDALDHGADYVLFLNNDTIVTPEFLQLMVHAAEREQRIGIVGCKIFYADSDPDGKRRIWSLGG